MPHYDYHCSNCGHQLEVFQKISDSSIKDCPQCHQSTLKRGPGGGIGLHFQGSGFYITDYNSNSTSSEKTTQKTDKSTHSASCCPCGKSSSCSS